MNFPLTNEILLVKGRHSFLLVSKVGENFPLCIETFAGEYCQGVRAGELVVVSAPGAGPVEPAIMLLELVRSYHTPLIVLPKDHPGSRRLSYVVSVGPDIRTDCTIVRGTHPEQHLICSADELSGITLRATDDGVLITPFPATLATERINPSLLH
ncbi:MAG: alpha/beta hydrolase [Methanoregula sp.]|nr:alpha/beta hydrolase [Methanoregula sp.]